MSADTRTAVIILPRAVSHGNHYRLLVKDALLNGRTSYTLRFYTVLHTRETPLSGGILLQISQRQPPDCPPPPHLFCLLSLLSFAFLSNLPQTISLRWFATRVELALAWKPDRESFHVRFFPPPTKNICYYTAFFTPAT